MNEKFAAVTEQAHRFCKDYSRDGHPIFDWLEGSHVTKSESISLLNEQHERIKTLEHAIKRAITHHKDAESIVNSLRAAIGDAAEDKALICPNCKDINLYPVITRTIDGKVTKRFCSFCFTRLPDYDPTCKKSD